MGPAVEDMRVLMHFSQLFRTQNEVCLGKSANLPMSPAGAAVPANTVLSAGTNPAAGLGGGVTFNQVGGGTGRGASNPGLTLSPSTMQ